MKPDFRECESSGKLEEVFNDINTKENVVKVMVSTNTLVVQQIVVMMLLELF